MFQLPWIEKALGREPAAGGKVVGLSQAVSTWVRPGMALQFGSGLGYPMALLYEIVRQFWGKDPGFTFIAYGGSSTNLVPFLEGNLVRRVLCSYMGDPYPFPSPNPLIQQAFAEKKVHFEEWSMLTLTQRLIAGALGLPFFPTRSLRGSSLAENLSGYAEIRDPFSGRPTALVEALHPDLSLVHGWLADPDGNTVLNMPLVGNVYGPLAAREGAIVSVEKVVSREELSRCREHVRLPAEVVRAVVELPFGAHPSGHHHFPQRGKSGATPKTGSLSSTPAGPAAAGSATGSGWSTGSWAAQTMKPTCVGWAQRGFTGSKESSPVPPGPSISWPRRRAGRRCRLLPPRP